MKLKTILDTFITDKKAQKLADHAHELSMQLCRDAKFIYGLEEDELIETGFSFIEQKQAPTAQSAAA